MKGITKVVKSLKESGLLITRISKTIKNEAKERKGEFLPMLLGTLAASMLVFPPPPPPPPPPPRS